MGRGGHGFQLWGSPGASAPPGSGGPATKQIFAAGRNTDLPAGHGQPHTCRPCAAPAAVLIVLHGSNQTGQSVRMFSGHSFDVLARDGRVAVVYPDGLKKLWNHDKTGAQAADDVAFMGALVDHFHRLHGPVPVVIAGFSNGGQLAIRLIHEIPRKLHGAAIVGATLPRPGGLVFADEFLPLPVLLIHGTHDPVVPYGGEGWFGSLFGRNRVDRRHRRRPRILRPGTGSRPLRGHRCCRIAPESGRTKVTLTRYEQEGLAPVALYTVVGGGHVVPNRPQQGHLCAWGEPPGTSVPLRRWKSSSPS